jgi:hypothetical protein
MVCTFEVACLTIQVTRLFISQSLFRLLDSLDTASGTRFQGGFWKLVSKMLSDETNKICPSMPRSSVP